MALKIAVCVKVSPDPEKYDQIRLNPQTHTLIREGIDSVISSADLHAIELALSLKKKFGGTITIFSMGPGSITQQLREALGYGCDEAVLLSDRKFGRADSLATSYTLSEGIQVSVAASHTLSEATRAQEVPFDLILLGNASDDGSTAHVPSQLGEWLGLPHMTDVVSAQMEEEDSLRVTREIGNGTNTYEIHLPAVIGVSKRINKVRHPSIMNILQAKNKPLKTLGACDIPGIEETKIGAAGSPTLAIGFVEADYGRQCQTLTGSPEEIAAEILTVASRTQKGQV